jgi:spore germination protein YaaH
MNFLKIIILIIISLTVSRIHAQKIQSAHAEQQEIYSQYSFKSEAAWNALKSYTPGQKKIYTSKNKQLQKITYGWYPYWMGTAYYDFDYSLLSDVAYFSYEVNSQNGTPDDIYYWLTTEIVDKAHAAGSRIHLTATLFSGHETFFANPEAQSTFIDSIVSLVAYREADGVNIDFEVVPSSVKNELTALMHNLSEALKAYRSDAQLSIALPAVDWSNSFDVAAMADAVNYFIIMGYEYHWSGSAYAGPGAPKNNGGIWSAIDLTRSVNSYLEKGVPREQLVLGLPYYGRDWPVVAGAVPVQTEGSGSPKIYSAVRNDFNENEKLWDEHSSVSYYNYTEGTQNRQCWFNDTASLALIYDMIKMKDIAGMGIWALGYDGDYPDLWKLLEEKFTNEANIRTSGTFSDMGGPKGDYYNNEDWQFTIHPPEGDSLFLQFEYVDIEVNYDTLFIYAGEPVYENLINTLSGNDNPDLIKIPGREANFRFKSDGATTGKGWLMRWKIDEAPATDLIEPKPQKSLTVYPNPFSNRLTVDIESKYNQSIVLKLTDIRGRSVFQSAEKLRPGKNQINLSFLKLSLPPGYYVLTVLSEQNVLEKRSVKICKCTD